MPVPVKFFERKDETDQSAFSYYDPSEGPVGTVYLAADASQEEVLHETLHVALQWYVTSNPDSPFVSELLSSLDTVIKFVDGGGIDTINDMTPEYKEEALQVANLLKGLRNKAPTDAALELVSYGMTMRSFKDLIKRVGENPSPETKTWLDSVKGLWTSLVKLFGKFLGVSDTVANNVINNSLALLQKAADTLPAEKAGSYTRGNKLYYNRFSPEVLNSNEVPPSRSNRNVSDMVKGVQHRVFSDWAISSKFIFDGISWKSFWGEMKPDGTIVPGKLQNIASQIADVLRKDPNSKIAKMISWFNTGFMQAPTTNEALARLSVDRGASYQLVTELTKAMRYWDNSKVAAMVDFLDNNDPTLMNAYPDAKKWISVATTIRDEVLPELASRVQDPETAAYFDLSNKTFTEAMIQVSDDKAISKHTFGLGDFSEQIKAGTISITPESMETLIGSLINRLDDGNGDLSGDFYKVEVLVDPVTNTSYTTFVSADKYNALDGDIESAYEFGGTIKPIDTNNVYSYAGFINKNHRFRGRKSYKDAFDTNKSRSLIMAIENTLGGLSSNYASSNFLSNLAATEGGNDPVVFADVQALNNYVGTDKFTNESVAGYNAIMSPRASAQVNWAARGYGSFVKLPESASWGALAGKIVPSHLLVALKDTYDRSPLFGQAYNTAVQAFKASKTIYNPGTQITNVVSNVSQAIMLGIPLGTIKDAARIMALYEKNPGALSQAEIDLAIAFTQSGAQLGNFANAELRKFHSESVVSAMTPLKGDSVLTKFTGFLDAQTNMNNSAEKFINKAMKEGKTKAEATHEFFEGMYNLGDNMFRLAAFMNKAAEVMADSNINEVTPEITRIAGRYAKEAFVDYDISSPAIKLLRQTALPFVSFTYGLIPVMAKAIAFKPWLIVNFMLATSLADMTLSAVFGEGDDEEDRRLGQEGLENRIFGFGPRMFWRMPNFGDSDVPVYLNFGDYLPMYAITKSDLPNPFFGADWWPQSLTPGNPFFSAAMTLFGFDMFLGESFADKIKGDPERDRVTETVRRITDIWMPPAIGAENRDRYFEAMAGNPRLSATGKSPSSSILIAQKLLGLRIVEADPVENAYIREVREGQAVRKYNEAVSAAKREAARFGYYDEALLNERLEELYEELQEELQTIYKIEE
jgi:Flp pilus assembly protein TadG